jgi:hypothetical protein
MHLHTEFLSAAVLVATAMGCDSPDADNDDFNEPAEALSLTDEYGFLVNLIAVEAEERKP